MDAHALLVRRSLDGDARAFEELVRAFHRPLAAYLAGRGADPGDVDDLCQDTFLTAYRKLSTFDAERPFWAWLKGIAFNLFRNYIRKSRPSGTVLDDLADREAERLAGLDVLGALESCIEALDGNSRRLIQGRYREGRSVQELSRSENRGANSLSVTLVRIRNRLRECVEGKVKDDG